jgi:hypothetical protein
MESKYYCGKCEFKCNHESHWSEHIKSKRHCGEKRKERCDKKLEDKCKYCDYVPSKTTNYKLHYLNKHATKEERIKEFLYYCEKCDFGTNATILFQRHLETQKHLNL